MQFEFPFRLLKPRARSPLKEWLRVGTRHVQLALVPNRRARRYVLRLRPDGTARVSIPRGGSAVEARRFAEKNIPWLERQFLRHALRPPRSRAWTIGTEILFRGESVRIEETVDGEQSLIRFADQQVRLKGPLPPIFHARRDLLPGCSCRHKEAEARNSDFPPPPHVGGYNGYEIVRPGDLRPAVERHLWRLAARELPVRVGELATLHQFTVGRVMVRNQRSRWGSCSRQGTISLNWRLIQTGEFVRDYIILHELAHLKHMNHSRRFWAEVRRLCPDFKRAEAWLKSHGELLS